MSTATVAPMRRTSAPRAVPAPGNTKLAKAQRAIELERLEKERRAEANKAQRISAENKFVLFALLGMALFMSAASFALSFTGLYGASAWAIGDASPVLRLAAPLMLDVSILSFTAKLFIERERGERVMWTWVWIAALAATSSASNVLHALSVTTATTLPELVAGCFLAGIAPLLLALVTDAAGKLVFKKTEADK